ncbi:MAG: hypothetical protein HC828_18550, partial [Blastochloris sp.]|nr:hypothetical protein [Blastochloris sp.]
VLVRQVRRALCGTWGAGWAQVANSYQVARVAFRVLGKLIAQAARPACWVITRGRGALILSRS